MNGPECESMAFVDDDLPLLVISCCPKVRVLTFSRMLVVNNFLYTTLFL